MNYLSVNTINFLNKMNSLEYLKDSCFDDFPEWKKEFETVVRPGVDNELNEMIEQLNSAENQVQDEGIELAIQRYGLRPAADKDNREQPSTSQASNEPEVKKSRTEPSTEDVLVSAVGSAIAKKGLMRLQS